MAAQLNKTKLRMKNKKRLQALFSIINLTLVSQITTLPILLINFKQLSIISPLANVLVLWTFPFLLASLIVALFLSTVLPFLSLLWFLPAYLLLKFIFSVSTWLASFSWAALSITNFNWRQGTLYYLFLILIVSWLSRRAKKRSPEKGSVF
jgi:competence protein ComEC